MTATTVFLIFCTLISLSKPEGFYHQEYNYTSSSSSFKNNELQHKNEDAGHYSKDGDLAGRFKPKVNAHSQHSQYINPKLQQNGYTSSSSSGIGSGGLYNRDVDLYGNRKTAGQLGFAAGSSYGANTAYQGNQFYGSNENLRSVAQRLQNQLSTQLQDAIYNQHQESSAYSNSISNAQVQSDARELEDELKRNLTIQLQEALRTQFGNQGIRDGAYYSISNGHLQPTANYNNQEIEDLTQQIQNNLNRELQEGMRTQYRTSSSQSSSQISTSNSHQSNPYGTTYVQRPHYTNPDTEYVPVGTGQVSSGTQHGTSSTSDSEFTSSGSRYPSSGTHYPSSGTHYPSSGTHYPSSGSSFPSSNGPNIYPVSSGPQYPTSGVKYPSSASSTNSHVSSGSSFATSSSSGSRYPASSQYPSNTYPSNGHVYPSTGNIYPSSSNTDHQYTANSNSESITTIASKVQDDLDNQLNRLLEDTQRKYFTSNNYQFNSQSNWNNILAQLEQDLKRNLTEQFDNELRRNYGSSYSYSNSNYNSEDHDNLKQQMERNLLAKLTRDFNRQKERYQQSYSTSSSSSSSGQIYGGTQPDYTSNNYGNSHIKTGSQNSYNHLAGSRQSGYEVQQPSMSQVELSDIQQQLQNQLSRQLQAAISKNQYSNSYSASASTSYNPQVNYQTSLQHLTDELNRNLTEQLNTLLAQQYGSQYSQYGGSSSSSGGYSQAQNAQLANLKNQLQNDLQKQLQQGLRQSYSRYSSWSSSSSTNYRPTRDYGPITYKGGHQNAGMGCTDCMMGDDPNAYQADQVPNQQQNPHGYNTENFRLTYGYGQNNRQRFDYSRQHQIQLTHGGEVSGGAYIQQQRQNHHERLQNEQAETGQQTLDDSDLTQQTEDIGFGQQSDLTQQTEDVGFGHQQPSDLTQQTENIEFGQQQQTSDLTQQTRDFETLETGSQRRRNKYQHSVQQSIEFGQQIDDNSDLTQQTQDVGYQKLENQHQNLDVPQETEGLGQKVVDLGRDLTQQTEDVGFGKLEISNQQQIQTSHHPTNDLVQETESFGQRRRNNYQQTSIDLGQQTVDDSDLTQQTEDVGFGKLETGNQQKPSYQRPFLFSNQQQQQHNSDLTQQHEQNLLGQQTVDDDSDLTQQTEDVGFEKLEQKPTNQRPWSFSNQQQHQQNSDLTQQHQQNLLGQQTVDDDSDLTQQTEDVGFGNLQTGNQQVIGQQATEQHLTQQHQQTDQFELNQQIEEKNFGKLENNDQQILHKPQMNVDSEFGHRYRPWKPRNQYQEKPQQQTYVDSSSLTQQTEDVDFVGKLETGSNKPQAESNQNQWASRDLTQQQTDDFYLTQHSQNGGLESGSPNKPERVNEISDSSRRNRPWGPEYPQQQQNTDSDLTQQQEQVSLGQQTDDLNQEIDPKSFSGSFIYDPKVYTTNKPKRFRTQQDIQLTANQDIPKRVVEEDYQQPIEPDDLIINKTYKSGDLLIQNAEDVVDLDKITQENVNSFMGQVTNDFEKLNKRKQQIQTTNTDTEEKLRKQQELERAISQTELLINALKKKSEQNHLSTTQFITSPNYDGRTYQQQSRSQQQVRITYNPRIVHYPSSSTQTQQQIVDNQQQINDFEQQQQGRQNDDQIGFGTNYNNQEVSQGSSYNSYQVQHSYSHQMESTQDQDHIHPGMVHFGTSHQIDDGIIEAAPEIEPIHSQQATVVEDVSSQRRPSYGIKTSHRVVETPPAEEFSTVNTEVEFIETTTTAKPGFWSRLGTRVKDSAISLKEKIVG